MHHNHNRHIKLVSF